MVIEAKVDEIGDQFPAGLRVLAVDDEPTCLKVLEILLTSCKYRVRTTNRALEALAILRENKFDLVISDVCMPDMDGLKLLELVGLEMDLPVIMLSANADPKVVMKGIDHGACDYLLKPIRVEELKNIWQHVVRKKKHDLRNQNNSSNQERRQHQLSGNVDPNENTSRKRKDQEDEAVEEVDDNGESEDPSAPKKPRVVWSMDLHRKFVYAVNQLGFDKAVPKKILDLMNVERLTRENVASHLQKYRIYLKRMSSTPNRPADNAPANLGNPDSNYRRTGSTDRLGSYYPVTGTNQFQNTTFNSYPPTGMLGHNPPPGLTMHSLPSPHAQNSSSVKFRQGMFPGSQNGGVLQGMPTASELEELRNINDVNVGGLSNAVDDMTIFPGSNGFPDGNHSSAAMTSPNSALSSHLPIHGRANINWSNVVPPYGSQPNSFALGDGFQQAPMHHATALPIGSASPGAFSAPAQLQYRRTELQGQAAPNISNVVQGLDFYRQDVPHRPNFMDNGANGALNPQNINFGGSMNINLTRQPNFVNHGEFDRSGEESSMQRQEAYLPGQQNPQGSLVSNNFGSLEDLATTMMRNDFVMQPQNSAKPDGYFGPGSYPPRTSQ